MFVCLSAWRLVFLSVCLSVCPSDRRSVFIYVCMQDTIHICVVVCVVFLHVYECNFCLTCYLNTYRYPCEHSQGEALVRSVCQPRQNLPGMSERWNCHNKLCAHPAPPTEPQILTSIPYHGSSGKIILPCGSQKLPTLSPKPLNPSTLNPKPLAPKPPNPIP